MKHCWFASAWMKSWWAHLHFIQILFSKRMNNYISLLTSIFASSPKLSPVGWSVVFFKSTVELIWLFGSYVHEWVPVTFFVKYCLNSMHNTNKMLMRFGIRPKLHFRYISYKVHDSKVEFGRGASNLKREKSLSYSFLTKTKLIPPKQPYKQTN